MPELSQSTRRARGGGAARRAVSAKCRLFPSSHRLCPPGSHPAPACDAHTLSIMELWFGSSQHNSRPNTRFPPSGACPRGRRARTTSAQACMLCTSHTPALVQAASASARRGRGCASNARPRRDGVCARRARARCSLANPACVPYHDDVSARQARVQPLSARR
eukprot:4914982-Pleurochrysis_carterae.AAC.3